MNYVNLKVKFLNTFFNKFFNNFFFLICMYKNGQTLSAKHYQENKERLQKKLVKDSKIYLKKKKKTIHNMVMKITKISQRMNNKGC